MLTLSHLDAQIAAEISDLLHREADAARAAADHREAADLLADDLHAEYQRRYAQACVRTADAVDDGLTTELVTTRLKVSLRMNGDESTRHIDIVREVASTLRALADSAERVGEKRQREGNPDSAANSFERARILRLLIGGVQDGDLLRELERRSIAEITAQGVAERRQLEAQTERAA